jgi:hypothetical protein
MCPQVAVLTERFLPPPRRGVRRFILILTALGKGKMTEKCKFLFAEPKRLYLVDSSRLHKRNGRKIGGGLGPLAPRKGRPQDATSGVGRSFPTRHEKGRLKGDPLGGLHLSLSALIRR